MDAHTAKIAGLVIDSTYAAVGSVMLDLGLIEDEEDLPQLEQGTCVHCALVHLNSWVSRCLGRVVVVVPVDGVFGSDLPGIALTNLLREVLSCDEDAV